MSATIAQRELLRLVKAWLDQGKQVSGPARLKPDRVLYKTLVTAGELVLDGFIRPANSVKEFVFPRHEKLYDYRFSGKAIELVDRNAAVPERIVIGARPCDAAALPVMDRVFDWDCRDESYRRHREATVLVTLACAAFDEHCFCSSVGLGPAAERGSDVLLLPLEEGRYEVRCLTPKGERLFAGKTETSGAGAAALTAPNGQFDPAAIRVFLEANFDHPVWKELALRCVGCGICAYACPTCHCFDIVDEGNAAGGSRCKNWDSCQFALFTLHASGHNPRAAQSQRQRQRIQHKFRIYPEKFGEILCTGCGNCARHCPVSLGVLDTLRALDALASRTP